MPPMIPFNNPWIFLPELVFALLIIVLCGVIYIETRKMHTLTNHKGISHFRNAFLFFALAFLFRFIFHMIKVSGFVFDYRLPREIMGPLPLVITGYFSTMAIFYIVYSMVWKRIAWKYTMLITHLIAIAVCIILFFTRSIHILAGIQILLIIFAAVLAFLKSRHSKGFRKIFVIYVFMFIAWVSNVLALSPRFFLPVEVKYVTYLISVFLFAMILYKVLKWTR